jgi:hypothetical protein
MFTIERLLAFAAIYYITIWPTASRLKPKSFEPDGGEGETE